MTPFLYPMCSTRTLLGGVMLLLLLGSCNVARMHTRKCDGRLERNGYRATTFCDTAGSHFTWYRDTGKEKILLLHGYSGTGALQWSKSTKLLGDSRDAILPDLLCHGSSTANWGYRPGGNIDAQVAHVLLLLDSLGVVQPIDVVGSSYGGGVAARLAELHPGRVKQLLIYDGLLSDYTKDMADSIARSVGGSGMLAVMSAPSARDLRFGIRLALYRDPPIPGFILRQIYEENVKDRRPAQVTLIKDLMDHEAIFATHRYDWRVPVYLVWGERDELIPNSTGLAIMQRNNIPTTHWSTVPRTGHVANIERPRAFDAELRRILTIPD